MEFNGFNIQFSGLNFGKIQNIIYDSEQGMGPDLNFLNIIFLFSA